MQLHAANGKLNSGHPTPPALLVCVLLAFPVGETHSARQEPPWLGGSALASELEAVVPGAAWQRVELRRILRRLGEDRRIAVLLDRRIDPNQPLTLEVSRQSVADVLRGVAERAEAAVSVAANTVYVGPPVSAARLRTLIELRTGELREVTARLPPDRRLSLFRRATVAWEDLDEPRGLLEALAARFQVRITNAETVPHDLWAGATLPDVNLAEALTLLLIQFDLTFRWNETGDAVELLPIPAEVAITKSHRPRRMPADQAVAEWQREFPGLSAEPRGGTVVVRGTVEQHEAIERLAAGRPGRLGLRRTPPREGGPDRPRPTPLDMRTFTIRQRVTAAALIDTLEKSGIEIEYDPQALAAAGVDLDQGIDLNLMQARADEFFRAWCGPLGLDFRIEDLTVTLSPR